jgi:hypothetical protein
MRNPCRPKEMRDFSTKVQEASVSRILNAEIGSGCMIDVNDGYARGVSDAICKLLEKWQVFDAV